MKKISIYILTLLMIILISTNTTYAKIGENKKMETIQIYKNGTFPSNKGPESYFTGSVRVESMLPTPHNSNVSLATVTFEPKARTNWHTHPVGQLLVVTYGLGLVQEEGGKIREIKAGDTVWFPPNIKHWHGASSNMAMSHISIVNMDKGNAANWLEKVTDEQYKKGW